MFPTVTSFSYKYSTQEDRPIERGVAVRAGYILRVVRPPQLTPRRIQRPRPHRRQLEEVTDKQNAYTAEILTLAV